MRMQVYGDIERTEDARDLCAEVALRLQQLHGFSPGLARHQGLIAAFIRASELVQGIADAEFAQAGNDEISVQQDSGAVLLLALAEAIKLSLDSGFTEGLPLLDDCLPLLTALSGAGKIQTRQAEGYAFYALYPESYIAAARKSRLGPDTMVIGIRSIGTGLAALVATALDAAAAVTLRPFGHPFDRRVAIGSKLAARLLESNGDYAIVDEGPGLSGSSFNSVAGWLVEHGVSESRIHFFPSHVGDLGGEARPDHRRRWSTSKRHFVPFEKLLLETGDNRPCLQDWIASLTGPLDGPLQDLSGGQWRALRDPQTEWPPADPALEKRKFLAVSNGKPWLAKFAGIGSSGEAKLVLAHRLAAAGFAPEPLGLCHGFLITPWIEQANTSGAEVPASRVLDYLTFRAGLPTHSPRSDLSAIFEMAIQNLGERWGDTVALATREALGDPQRFHPVPCCTDNRMHAWEWINTKEGWLKMDGLDHHAAHDLVGCQDIAWDVAGAVVELNLSEAAGDQLVTDLSIRIGREISAEFVAANVLCYLGLQIGLWTMAIARAGEDERPRIVGLLARYERHPALVKRVGRD
ncbi:MAG: cell division protein FtsK [Devosia sp.]|nr:cell division protein FtsK [Devosia sp.]